MFTTLPMRQEEQNEIARRLFDHLEHGTTDSAPTTMRLDPREYFDAELARREREEIFASVPIVAAHGSELAMPNDFVTVRLPNNEAIVVRQPDGGVKAFVNTCRHRGARLVNDACGANRVFACTYHGWTYDTDGRLRSILGGAQGFGVDDTSCLGLVELPAEERHGWVWVVDAAEATIDVRAWLGREMDESLASFELNTYVCDRVGNFDEPINWKVLMDAFFDAYHLQTTHRNSVAPYFHNNVQVWQPLGRHGRTFSPRKSIDAIRHLPPGDEPIDNHITVAHFFMPNMSLLRQPDHFELLTFLPHPTDPDRCTMQMRILTKERATTDEAKARWDKNWAILMRVLRDEDLVMNRALQQAVHNRDVQPLVIGRNEIVNQHFHRWLAAALDDPRHWG
jgi:phenylpropionate dioxygenase-like ring-hydroxylating dioxygenase large terminal subunit